MAEKQYAPIKEECGTCRFGRRVAPEIVRCRFNPPPPGHECGGQDGRPLMDSDDWCGRWKVSAEAEAEHRETWCLSTFFVEGSYTTSSTCLRPKGHEGRCGWPDE